MATIIDNSSPEINVVIIGETGTGKNSFSYIIL
jgi:transcriptional regulator with PAS, ATPase and Fis domain